MNTFDKLISTKSLMPNDTEHDIEIEYSTQWNVNESGLPLKESIKDAIELFEEQKNTNIESMTIINIVIDGIQVPLKEVLKIIGRNGT